MPNSDSGYEAAIPEVQWETRKKICTFFFIRIVFILSSGR